MTLFLPSKLAPIQAVINLPGDVLWRCESRVYSYVIDADREEYGTTAPKLEFMPWPVVRRTPKGAWIQFADGFGRTEKFILLSARRRFAANTQIEALADFRDRRRRMRYVLTNKIARCDFEIELATRQLEAAR